MTIFQMIQRLEKNEWNKNFESLNVEFIKDLICTLSHKNNTIVIARQPVFTINGTMYSADSQKFNKTEDVINFFDQIHDSDIGLFTVVIQPETLQRTRSVIVRYATDYFRKGVGENMKQEFLKPKNEFLTIEEMSL